MNPAELFQLYKAFDYPSDQLANNDHAKAVFAQTCNDVFGTENAPDQVGKLLVNYRKNNDNFPHLGRKWKGPNYMALRLKAGHLLQRKETA